MPRIKKADVVRLSHLENEVRVRDDSIKVKKLNKNLLSNREPVKKEEPILQTINIVPPQLEEREEEKQSEPFEIKKYLTIESILVLINILISLGVLFCVIFR